MEDFRSKSYNANNGMQIQPYNNNNNKHANIQDFRCYSASYASSSYSQTKMDQYNPKVEKNNSKSTTTTSGSMSKNWSLSDPELQRKKRVATYKAYTVEGKVKGSFKKSFRWIKDKYTQMVYGLRSSP